MVNTNSAQKGDNATKRRMAERDVGSKPMVASDAKPSANETPMARATTAWPIVGIGASAGGLEAMADLLKALPAKPGLAMVLVSHLDPQHTSHLVELLRRISPLPVVEIADGMEVEADQLYVIPPNSHVTIKDGLLHLALREEGPGHKFTIDRFFTSLAEECGPMAVGVILSGALSDGTKGMREIKAAGGVTLAQDLASARYPEMPRSAMAANGVDFALPPAEIASELVRLVGHLPRTLNRREPSEPHEKSIDEDLQLLLRTLMARTGVDFSQYKRTTLERRIGRRMLATRQDTYRSYERYLGENPTEAQALSEEMLIHVTQFFRTEEAYTELISQVLPKMLEGRPADMPVRVWVPACATGEEAYSMAIILVEYLQAHNMGNVVQVLATDLSPKAIQTAREGGYPHSIATDVSPERLVRHFTKSTTGYEINKAIRGMCVFASHNLTTDPPFSNLDIVSCRNLLVYMDAELQRRVFVTLHYALRPGGILVLGTSESVGRSEDLFEAAGNPHIFTKKNVTSPMRQPSVPHDPNLPVGMRPARPVGNVWKEADIQGEADRILLQEYAPAGVVVNSDLEAVHFQGDTGRYLGHPAGRAGLNLMNLARGDLAMPLRAAVQEATTAKGQPVFRRNLEIVTDGQRTTLDVEVRTLRGPAPNDRYFLILFIAKDDPANKARTPRRAKPTSPFWGWLRGETATLSSPEILDLENQLATAREHLRSIMQQYEGSLETLQSANEEAVSSNEELQSTNEELETTKEELQSTNEELNSLNEELQQRTGDVQKINGDLLNLLNSVRLAIVMLGIDLRIRRFTPKAEKLFSLISTDAGRPITDIQAPFQMKDLRQQLLEVIENGETRQVDVQDTEGRPQILQMSPYRAADGKIDGVVMVVYPKVAAFSS